MEMTLNEIAQHWMKEKTKLVKTSTIATYAINLEKHILPHFGENTQVAEDDVQEFVYNKAEEGLNIKTVKDILMLFRMIMKFGSKKGWISYDAWDIKYPKDNMQNRIQVLTISEQKDLMAHLYDDNSFKNLGLLICLNTGIRIGEICALKWGDININAGIIQIRRTYERIYMINTPTPHSTLIMQTPKTTNSARDIPICSTLSHHLRLFIKNVSKNHYILTNSEKPLEPNNYRHHYKRIMKRIGLPLYKFHTLRHSFATRCIESGCDCKTVSSLLGHSNISTTLNLYVHPSMEQKRKCIDFMLKVLD
jgi:integrase